MFRLNALVIFILSLIFSLTVSAQREIPVWQKMKYLSEEEMRLEVRTQEGFTETDPPAWPIKNVAEFDRMQAVLVRYPLGIPVSMIEELAKDIEVITLVANASQEATVLNIYGNNGVNLNNCTFIHAPTNSYWVRDYGPWFVFDGNNKAGIVDFPYNRPRPADNDIPAAVAKHFNIDLYGMNLTNAGGNYMTDGLGKSSSTDLITDENPSLSEDAIDTLLYHYLAIEDFYILPDPLDEYIKHIDCWGKFLTPEKVIIGQVPESDYRYQDFEEVADFFKNQISSYGVPFEVFRIYTPGTWPNTPYTNSIIVNDKVLVPLTGSEWDDEAIVSYEEALPGYKIVGIEYNGWYNTDAVHCRAKGVADLGLLYIKHLPKLGIQAFKSKLTFSADIIAFSGAEIIADSVLLHYSINGDDYESSLLTLQDDGLWSSSLEMIQPGDFVKYYIEANDLSGRKTKHPFIGAADPHEFTMKAFIPELSLTPDTLYFQNDTDMTDGLDAQIVNISSNAIIIENIDLPDHPDYTFLLRNEPVLPYLLGESDTLNLHISLDEPLPPHNQLFLDSIMIQSTVAGYPLVIIIDRISVNTDWFDVQTTLRVYPNPSDGFFIFEYPLDRPERVELKVYTQKGIQVYSTSEDQLSGNQKIYWGGVNNSGKKLAPGTYLYTIKMGEKNITGVLMMSN